MAKKIVVTNQKGGVGKTTTAHNIAALLALKGRRVLAIDLCTQANLSISFGIDITAVKNSIREVLMGQCPIEDAVVHKYENLDIIPARKDLETIASIAEIAANPHKAELLKVYLHKAGDLEQSYDYMMIDTGPAVQSLLTMNGLTAADYYLIPTLFDMFAVTGLGELLVIMQQLRNNWQNRNIKNAGILGTFYRNTRNSRYFEDMVVGRSPYGKDVLSARIRQNVALSSCVKEGLPITLYDKSSHGYHDYNAATDELIAKIEGPLNA